MAGFCFIQIVKLLSTAVLICLQISCCYAYSKINSQILEEKSELNSDKPLILTHLIQQGRIAEAQAAADVKFKGFESVKSYAGFLTVDERYDSNMFFWFFPSQSGYANDPVVLYLEGGQGTTTLMGLFIGNGPFEIKTGATLKLRKTTWTQNHSVLYIDNPVGAGFSFTNADGYSKNETAVGVNLYNTLLQFFQLFPELQKNNFFVTSESYGGKFAPAVSYVIHTRNPSATQKINLKGLAIGNGFSDPEHQCYYAEQLYQIGLIDANGKTLMQKYEQEGIQYIKNKQWLEALRVINDLLSGDLSKRPSVFKNLTGFNNRFDFLMPNSQVVSNGLDNIAIFMSSIEARNAVHAGNVTFNVVNRAVRTNLLEDILQSVAPWVSELLDHYPILLYNGQLDLSVPYPSVVNYLQHLNFNAAEEYKTATRHQWYVNDTLAGYIKRAGNLIDVLVRNSGHLVLTDQPEWALDLLTRFTRSKPFY